MPPPCPHCKEPMLAGEDIERFAYGGPYHHECYIRLVRGTADRQLSNAAPYWPGEPDPDPPGMTPRQAARHALDVYQQVRHV